MKENLVEEKEQNIMGTMDIPKLVRTISTPMIISMLVQAFYNIVDSAYVAQLSNTDNHALTALSLSFPVQNLMIAVSAGTGVGINAALSRALGANEPKRANTIAKNGIFLAFISSFVFILLGMFFVKPFFISQTNVQQVVDYGIDYLSICTLFSIGICGQIVFERTLQSTGKSVYSMIAQTVGAFTNIILDPILIFGLLGFPRMEVKGAAIATVIGQILGMLVALFFNITKNKELNFSFRGFKPDIDIIKVIYKVGIPSILLQSVASIMTYGINKILSSFDEVAISAFGIYFKVQSFIFMPVFGLNNGMIPILSYNYGAKNKERMIQTIKTSIFYAVIIMLLGFVGFQIFPRQIMNLFNANEELMKTGVTALRILSISFLFAGFTVILVSSFQALGFGFKALITSVTRQLVVLLPVAYLLSFFNNVDLVWLSFPIAELVCLIVSIIFFRTIYNDVIKPMDDEDTNPKSEAS